MVAILATTISKWRAHQLQITLEYATSDTFHILVAQLAVHKSVDCHRLARSGWDLASLPGATDIRLAWLLP